MSRGEVRVHYAALQVSLLKSRMIDASEALAEWAEDWLDVDQEDFAEQLLDDADISSWPEGDHA